jgi:hypothetical protein
MDARRHIRPSRLRCSAWLRRTRKVAIATALTMTAVLVGGVATSLADVGSVYVDAKSNVGAGHDFFGGTAPTSFDNVGLGYSVMPALTSGSENTATGSNALLSNTTGDANVASGFGALQSNTTGANNVATGTNSLAINTTGRDNVASGLGALNSNTSGKRNVAAGLFALRVNTTGHDNTAAGYHALQFNTDGAGNVALGSGAGENLTTGSGNIDIANPGVAGEGRKIRIGTVGNQNAAFIAGISGNSIAGPAQPVLVNSSGELGTAASAPTQRSARRNGVRRLKAHVRRQDKEIATLTREVAKLSRG